MSKKQTDLLLRLRATPLEMRLHPKTEARQWYCAGAKLNPHVCLALIYKELIATQDDLLDDRQTWHLTARGQRRAEYLLRKQQRQQRIVNTRPCLDKVLKVV